MLRVYAFGSRISCFAKTYNMIAPSAPIIDDDRIHFILAEVCYGRIDRHAISLPLNCTACIDALRIHCPDAVI